MSEDYLKNRNFEKGMAKKTNDFLYFHKKRFKDNRNGSLESDQALPAEKSYGFTDFDSFITEVHKVQEKNPVEARGVEKAVSRYSGRGIETLSEYAETLKSKVRIISYDDLLFLFDGVCYVQVTPKQLTTKYRECVDYDLHNAKSMRVTNELYNYLQTDPKIVLENVDYQSIDNLAVLENGIFDVAAQKLYKHSSEYYVFSYVKANYIEDAACPVFEKFLDTITKQDKVLKKRMWYLLAYICMQSVSAKAFFVFGTKPNSGKSVFGKFLQSLFKREYVSSVALYEMHKDFALAPVVGKALNLSMDLPSGKLNAAAVSNLKMLTGEDMMCINEKHIPRFGFRNRAKMIFASNHPILIQGEDEAFWDRLVYFPFENSIPKKEQDPHLLDKLMREKDAIVSKALRYGKKFIKNHYVFPTTQEIEDTIAVWRGERSFSVERFLTDCCVISSTCEGEWTANLYSAYRAYCENHAQECVSKETFRHIMELQRGVKSKKFRKKGSSENSRHGFVGIELLDNEWGGDKDVADY